MSIFDTKPKDPIENVRKDGEIIFAREITVGAGTNATRINSNGVFVGGLNYETAPTKIGTDGSIRIYDSSGNLAILIDPNG